MVFRSSEYFMDVRNGNGLREKASNIHCSEFPQVEAGPQFPCNRKLRYVKFHESFVRRTIPRKELVSRESCLNKAKPATSPPSEASNNPTMGGIHGLAAAAAAAVRLAVGLQLIYVCIWQRRRPVLQLRRLSGQIYWPIFDEKKLRFKSASHSHLI